MKAPPLVVSCVWRWRQPGPRDRRNDPPPAQWCGMVCAVAEGDDAPAIPVDAEALHRVHRVPSMRAARRALREWAEANGYQVAATYHRQDMPGDRYAFDRL